MKLLHAIAAGLSFLLFVLPVQAQDIAGQWQGVQRSGTNEYRIALRIENEAGGGLRITAYSLSESVVGMPTQNARFDGKTLFFAIERINGSYSGTLSPDGNILSGIFTQDGPQSLNLQRATPATAWVIDAAAHQARPVTVDKDVTLEVLDFGGSGRPLIFLAGLGATGHDFDSLAPKFTATHHVYAITRRGFGMSSVSAPTAENYSATRLAKDVLAVMDTLKLERPVLAGHSIAGEELSAIANQSPDKVAGLIYLDAGYAYAFYTPQALVPYGAALKLSTKAMLASLDRLVTENEPMLAHIEDFRTQTRDLRAAMDANEQWLTQVTKVAKAGQPPAARGGRPAGLNQRIAEAIQDGEEKFTTIKVPVLALYATDPKMPANAPADMAVLLSAQAREVQKQIDAFAAGVPAARVVRLPGANHRVWFSHEAEVLRQMREFLAEVK